MEARAAGTGAAGSDKVGKSPPKYFVACRQFVYQSLQEKLRNKIPQLSLIEKKWLILQLLCAVSQIHSRDKDKDVDSDDTYAHGDIKPENILLTSYDQVFLTDLVRYKPTYIEEEGDDKIPLTEYNRYFGEMCAFGTENGNARCYLAPERFRDRDAGKADGVEYRAGGLQWGPAKPEMDIFSTGCVIAEILSADDQPLFDLASLRAYRNSGGKGGDGPAQQDGTGVPTKEGLFKRIAEPLGAGASDEEKQRQTQEVGAMVDLIMKMVAVNPA